LNRLDRLRNAGVSIWLDDLSRELLETGAFAELVEKSGITGATSNPTIFAKAITGSGHYDDQLRALIDRGTLDGQALFFELALEDVRRAAKALRPAYDESHGRDGFVSFECTPDLADDAEATTMQALDVCRRLEDLPNVLIKVAATDAGIDAIQELTAGGVRVNATLLFSQRRHQQAIDAYLNGLERRADAGKSIKGVSSVASFFVSRIDAMVDEQLDSDSPLRGRIAMANAELAYARQLRTLDSQRWRQLAMRGATPQRLLWASTATKDPAYSDTRYVQELIAANVINTMPLSTLEAFADHGDIGRSLGSDVTPARQLLNEVSDAGVDFAAITDELERKGIEGFNESYRKLLDCIASRVERLRAGPLNAEVAR
jgi:transaldolase